jgi:hypothetical protein
MPLVKSAQDGIYVQESKTGHISEVGKQFDQSSSIVSTAFLPDRAGGTAS